MRLKSQIFRITIIFALLVVAYNNVNADAISDWNAIAVQSTVTGGRPGPSGMIDVAMVQAAVYDAVQAIEKDFQPYYVEVKGASGSPVAAAAKAARDVLVSRFPMQAASLDATYQQYLFSHGLADTDPGVAVGATAAAGIIALRSCDGSFPNPAPPAFIGSSDIGMWRPTAPGFAPMLAPWMGNVTPFTLTRPSQFRADLPPDLTSRAYTKDYDEVKALGALNNSERTAEQTDLANFWNANYVVLWNKVFRDIADARVDNISDSARLFALADMSMADALITAWNNKNYHPSWRPITAIQLGDTDGNTRTIGDPAWQPLIVTPPYPDHTSGANSVSSAALRSLELFFGRDRMDFSITTTNVSSTSQDTRTYRRFSEARQEVVDARVYEGIHFRFADEAGRNVGKQVAGWAFENFLRPLGQDNNRWGRDDEHHDN